MLRIWLPRTVHAGTPPAGPRRRSWPRWHRRVRLPLASGTANGAKLFPAAIPCSSPGPFSTAATPTTTTASTSSRPRSRPARGGRGLGSARRGAVRTTHSRPRHAPRPAAAGVARARTRGAALARTTVGEHERRRQRYQDAEQRGAEVDQGDEAELAQHVDFREHEHPEAGDRRDRRGGHRRSGALIGATQRLDRPVARPGAPDDRAR